MGDLASSEINKEEIKINSLSNKCLRFLIKTQVYFIMNTSALLHEVPEPLRDELELLLARRDQGIQPRNG